MAVQAADADLQLVRNPVHYSATPITEYRASPVIGADTDAVLRSLPGETDTDITTLREARII